MMIPVCNSAYYMLTTARYWMQMIRQSWFLSCSQRLLFLVFVITNIPGRLSALRTGESGFCSDSRLLYGLEKKAYYIEEIVNCANKTFCLWKNQLEMDRHQLQIWSWAVPDTCRKKGIYGQVEERLCCCLAATQTYCYNFSCTINCCSLHGLCYTF